MQLTKWNSVVDKRQIKNDEIDFRCYPLSRLVLEDINTDADRTPTVSMSTAISSYRLTTGYLLYSPFHSATLLYNPY